MKIGNGLLKIGIFGNKEENSVAELEGLARDTLNFPPLEDIVKVSEIMLFPPRVFWDYLINIENFETLKDEKNLDKLAIIWKRHNLCDSKGGLIYSDPDPMLLAHEIGHSLGLEHPTYLCGYVGCNPPSNINRTCPFLKDIMGCAYYMGEGQFSPGDIAKLNELYLKPRGETA